MPGQFIFECPVLLPTLERAEKIVPPEFIPCYKWFIEHTDEQIRVLPHNMKPQPDTPVPLSRLSGIHSPSASRVKYANGRRYALSIHSSNQKRYADRKPLYLPDGTWIFDYAAYEGDVVDQGYNATLLNSLTDGIPVGVMVREKGGYRVLGLAFIERYNHATRMFTLHGPVTSQTVAAGTFAVPGFDELPPQEQQILIEYDGSDERRVVTAQQVRREQQGKFREALFKAYSGACAITGMNVPEVLQAAHINPYRGKKSQIVSNGILLRADLHLLYDAHLISVEPDSLEVAMSERLAGTAYLQYNKSRLHGPTDQEMAPSRDLLAMHYEQFRQENRVLVA